VAELDSASPFQSRHDAPTGREARPDAATVLVVEDDAAQRRVLTLSLSARGYHVVTAKTGGEALRLVGSVEPDVVILDLGLPDIDGIEVARHLRLWVRSPIIVLTADGSEERTVVALDLGADDYVTKPFSMPALLARVRVALRHRAALSAFVDDSALEVGQLRIDVAAHEAAVNGRPLTLQPLQFRLLTLLARNAGKLMTYRNLIRQLWPDEEDPDMRPLRVAVSIVRKQLGDAPDAPQILTEPQVGYRLVDPSV
jgi:two-component system KDP operon response regulator KdpE